MDADLKPIWDQVAAAIKPQVNADTFNRWFSGVSLVTASDERFVLRVPNHIYQLWIETNYMPMLTSAILSVIGANPAVEFVYQEDEVQAGATRRSKGSHEPAPEELDLAGGDGHAARPEAARRVRSPEAGEEREDSVSGMNPRNTFASFVVGSNNQFAHAACLAVGQAPGRTYNPLFIYGGVGLGKTHLMQAIGHFALPRKKGARVIYLSSEKFTNEFITAIQNGTLVKFRKRYRQADVLLIDDIQFLAGKERSQEEFFHTFNTLFDGHKQIVLSSDRPASEISNLENRLVSRFEWGLTAELQPPDMETRIAILRKKAESMQIQIAPAIIEFLADRIRSNVRRLEGALVRVASLLSLGNGDPGFDAIEHMLKDILQEEAKRTITIDQIQRRVAEHFDIRLADMTSKRRPANIAFPRQIAMFLARELTNSSLTDIGEAFGGRDHGTVLHAHRLVRSKSASDDKVRQVVSYLDNQLKR